MKIYTKTGDKGETSLYGGKRVFKNNLRIEAYGCIDELNSAIGLVLSKIKNEKLDEIQKDLFLIGSILAGYENTKDFDIRKLEDWIDGLEKDLPPIKNFIIPGGCEAAGFLHLARSICRKAERRVVELSQKENFDENIIVYLNRLSDFLFVLARFENNKSGIKEEIWKI